MTLPIHDDAVCTRNRKCFAAADLPVLFSLPHHACAIAVSQQHHLQYANSCRVDLYALREHYGLFFTIHKATIHGYATIYGYTRMHYEL